VTQDQKPRHQTSQESQGSSGPQQKRSYSPPKIEEFGSVLELTKGTGVGTPDTPMGTTSIKAV
jgi:hypothetical protein